jgi:hypothetical protein
MEEDVWDKELKAITDNTTITARAVRVNIFILQRHIAANTPNIMDAKNNSLGKLEIGIISTGQLKIPMIIINAITVSKPTRQRNNNCPYILALSLVNNFFMSYSTRYV